MTPELKPEDLKVGDVVDVTFDVRQFKLTGKGWSVNGTSFMVGEINGESMSISYKLLSNATITRSPEVIEAGDVVRVVCPESGPSMAAYEVIAIRGDRAWVDNYGLQSLSDLTLISKGAKS